MLKRVLFVVFAPLLAGPSLGCLWEPAATITRADLGQSYLAVETALETRPLERDRLAGVNRRFDQATIAFFLGNLRAAIAALDELAADINGTDRSGLKGLAAALKLSVDPPIYAAGDNRPAIVSIQAKYLTGADAGGAALFLQLRNPADTLLEEHPLDLRTAPLIDEQQALAQAPNLSPGTYWLELRTADGCVFGRRPWYVASRSLDDRRREHEVRLERLNRAGRPADVAPGDVAPADAASEESWRAALAIARARNALLSDRPSEQHTAEWFYDLTELADEVEAELTRLEAGANPYAGRAGDTWRVVRVGAAEVPLRVFAPSQPADATPLDESADSPAPQAAAQPIRRPLLIAFHGAGGDENMFFRAYGLGIIKTLAAERGVIVATPLTTAFLRDPAALDALLAELDRDYAIDPERIYVLGHSLGCVPAALAATSRAERIAAVCCLSGGGNFAAGSRTAPALLISGALDPISAPARSAANAERAAAAGRPVEHRRLESYGHTLIVGPILPEVFDWLLARRREAE